MILTDDDLMNLDGFNYDEPQFVAEKSFARAIEQAIIQKMGEPVAWKDRTYGNVHDSNYGYESWIPLYALPEVKK